MTMPLRLFYYLENVEDIGRLNWSQLVMDQLFKNMDLASHSVRRRERIGDRAGEYVHGCATVLNVFLWERTNLFPPSSVGNPAIFQMYEGSTKRRKRSISCLSDEEVYAIPRSYCPVGSSIEVRFKSMIQPTLKEFIRSRRINKHCTNCKKHDNLVSSTTVIPAGRNDGIDGTDESSRPEFSVDSNFAVDLCTPSPNSNVCTLSIGKSQPLPISFDDLNDNASEINIDGSYALINTPVLLEGLDIYDGMTTDAIQNYHISSSPKGEHVVGPSIDPLGISKSDRIGDKPDSMQSLSCPSNFGHGEFCSSTKQLSNTTLGGSIDIKPPSFDLLFEAVDRVIEGGIDISQCTSPINLNPYCSLLNMTKEDRHDVNETQFREESSKSADAVESKLKSSKTFGADEISDVVRCIDFSLATSSSPESPYVSSMIKIIKDRNEEKLENKKLKEAEEARLMKDDGKPKKNQTTKKLVMDSKYRSLLFFLINDDRVFCSGGDVSDIVHHQIYTNMILNFLAMTTDMVSPIDVDNVIRMMTRQRRGNDKRNWKYFVIPICTVKHWHFLVWSRVRNTYTHYDSNYIERECVNLGAAKRAMKWMTMWFRQNFVTVFHDEPTLVQFKDYPQETNPKRDGGLYMFHGISSFIDYMNIEDGIFNTCSLDSKMTWNKSEVPRIRNNMFRRLAERLEFTPWHTKLANYNAKS